MYNRMLVPLDGSELAEVVLPYAKELAGRFDLEVILLHVQYLEEHGFAMHRVYIEHVANSVRHETREIQTIIGTEPGARLAETRVELVVGEPAEEILRYADKNHIDLILMATHGRSGIRRWVFGSVADRVLRASKVPIWLVRARIPQEIVHDEWPKRSMLVPLDGSQLAESVLPHVEALAKQRGAELVNVVLLRVFEGSYVNADYPESSMNLTWKEHVRRVREHLKKEAKRYLEGVQNHLADAGLNVRSEVLMGKPADEIIDYAHKNHPNLVVMATHGYSGISRWEYGSTADKVLHGVTSPIFLVRPH